MGAVSRGAPTGPGNKDQLELDGQTINMGATGSVANLLRHAERKR
jgi:hypothetical protein